MARYNKYGFVYDQIISESLTLADAGNVTAVNTVTLDAPHSGMLKIVVCASSAGLTLAAAGTTLRITPLFGLTAATCTVRGVGTIELKEGDVTLTNTAGSATTKDYPDNSTWAAGERIVEILIPSYLAQTYKYMDLNFASSGTDADGNVEAYLCTV